jgi:hypothetical protein
MFPSVEEAYLRAWTDVKSERVSIAGKSHDHPQR